MFDLCICCSHFGSQFCFCICCSKDWEKSSGLVWKSLRPLLETALVVWKSLVGLEKPGWFGKISWDFEKVILGLEKLR